MTNLELIDRQMCQMCNQRRECIKENRDRCVDYEDAVELLKRKDQQFKEFIEKLKKWLKENTYDSSDERRCCSVYCAQDDFISDFETYMNKLLEK